MPGQPRIPHHTVGAHPSPLLRRVGFHTVSRTALDSSHNKRPSVHGQTSVRARLQRAAKRTNKSPPYAVGPRGTAWSAHPKYVAPPALPLRPPQDARFSRIGMETCAQRSLAQKSPLLGVDRSRDGKLASLCLVAPTPGHLLQRLQEINEFPVRKRAGDPGVISANKAPAIRDKAIHRVADNKVGMPAGINAIVLGPASHVIEHSTQRISQIYHDILYRCRKYPWFTARCLIRVHSLTFRRPSPCLAHGARPFPGKALQDDRRESQFRDLGRGRKAEYLHRQNSPACPRSQGKSTRSLRSL